MDIRQLKHFVAVFEQRNLSKAAEAIPLSQPALTRSMKSLEDQLGKLLVFFRMRCIKVVEVDQEIREVS